MSSWVGFDLDGTLAKYDTWEGPTVIGEPIAAIVEIAKWQQSQGMKLKIFTARMSEPDEEIRKKISSSIADWTEKHGLGRLESTCAKDYKMVGYYDDRAIQVAANEGLILQDEFMKIGEQLSKLESEIKARKA